MDEKVIPESEQPPIRPIETLEEATNLFARFTLLVAGYRMALLAQGFDYNIANDLTKGFQEHLLQRHMATDVLRGGATPGQYL